MRFTEEIYNKQRMQAITKCLAYPQQPLFVWQRFTSVHIYSVSISSETMNLVQEPTEIMTTTTTKEQITLLINFFIFPFWRRTKWREKKTIPYTRIKVLILIQFKNSENNSTMKQFLSLATLKLIAQSTN